MRGLGTENKISRYLVCMSVNQNHGSRSTMRQRYLSGLANIFILGDEFCATPIFDLVVPNIIEYSSAVCMSVGFGYAEVIFRLPRM